MRDRGRGRGRGRGRARVRVRVKVRVRVRLTAWVCSGVGCVGSASMSAAAGSPGVGLG